MTQPRLGRRCIFSPGVSNHGFFYRTMFQHTRGPAAEKVFGQRRALENIMRWGRLVSVVDNFNESSATTEINVLGFLLRRGMGLYPHGVP